MRVIVFVSCMRIHLSWDTEWTLNVHGMNGKSRWWMLKKRALSQWILHHGPGPQAPGKLPNAVTIEI